MKEIENNSQLPVEESLYEQVAKTNPRFASSSEAIAFYEQKLTELATRRGTTVPKLLNEAEESSVFDEEFLEARSLWGSLSAAKALQK